MQHLMWKILDSSKRMCLGQSHHAPYSQPWFSNAAAAVGRQAEVKINNQNVLTAAATLRPQVADSPSVESAPAIPLLNTLKASDTAGNLNATIKEDLAFDQGPLPYEEIPGPTVLKMWEKYWRYVPLFGTQLLRSVLINQLAEGRLVWGRNISPLRYLFNEYGPVVRLNGPLTGDIVLIHRPEHIAKVFEEEGDSPTRSGIDVLQYYRLNYRKYRFAGPYSAEGPQNVEWLQMKKTLGTPIAEQINKQFGMLEMTGDELTLRIRLIRNRQDEVPNNFDQELSRWGMESFWILMLNKKMGFLDSTGYNESSETTQFIRAVSDAHLYMSRCETGFQVWRFFETPYLKSLFGSCDMIDGIIGKYIRISQNDIRGELSPEREEEKQAPSTILENLLAKQRMNPDDISTLLMDMIILGVQAMTNSQAFLLYYLAKNPRAQKTLFDEIMSKTKTNPDLTKKTLNDMPYLDACIKECLRLRPAFPYITRLLSKSITLHGYKIPQDTYLIMANQISSLREENFEDPERFKPERWMKMGDDYSEFSSLPFGRGLKSCIGENMAKLQMKLLTTKIIREFRVEYDYADIGSKFLMMNVPNRPLRFRFVDRD